MFSPMTIALLILALYLIAPSRSWPNMSEV